MKRTNMNRVYSSIFIALSATMAVSCEHIDGSDIVISIIGVILIASLLIYHLWYRRKNGRQKVKVQELEEMYNAAVTEKEALSRMINQSVVIDEPIRKLLESRVTILDELLVNLIFDKHSYSPERAAELIESIAMDKETYMNTLGLIFSIRHPDITEYFKNCGLSTWEIGYCSLYCMGYKGKEIGNIMCSSKYYKLNSSIRKKLGMGPKDTNIDIYLRNLMTSFKSNKS